MAISPTGVSIGGFSNLGSGTPPIKPSAFSPAALSSNIGTGIKNSVSGTGGIIGNTGSSQPSGVGSVIQGLLTGASKTSTPTPTAPSVSGGVTTPAQNVGGGQVNGVYKPTGQNAGINPYTVGQTPTTTAPITAGVNQPAPPVTSPQEQAIFNANMKTMQGVGSGNTLASSPAAAGLSNAQTIGQYNPNSQYYSPTAPVQSFPGLIGSLSNQSGTPFNQTTQTASTGLLNAPAQNQAIGQQAENIASAAGNQMARIGQLGANSGTGQMSTGTSPVASGNAAITAANTAAQQQAIASGANLALQGTSQALTAQGQAQSGLTSAGSTANAGQNTAQSALSSAAGLSQPQLSQYGQTFYNPTTGQTTGGSQGVSPTDPFYQTLQTYANLLATNQGSAIPSSITGNSVLNAQLQQMAKQINPSYNVNTAAGAGTAQQQNAQTAGTAQTQAALGSYTSSYPAVIQTNQALNNIESLGNLTVQNAQGNDINPFSAQAANATLASVRGQLSSVGQATFDSNIRAFQSALQSLYGDSSGNTPTNITAAITDMANGTMSIPALQGLLSAAKQEGQLKLQNAESAASAAFQQTQQGSQSNSTSGFGWNG